MNVLLYKYENYKCSLFYRYEVFQGINLYPTAIIVHVLATLRREDKT